MGIKSPSSKLLAPAESTKAASVSAYAGYDELAPESEQIGAMVRASNEDEPMLQTSSKSRVSSRDGAGVRVPSLPQVRKLGVNNDPKEVVTSLDGALRDFVHTHAKVAEDSKDNLTNQLMQATQILQLLNSPLVNGNANQVAGALAAFGSAQLAQAMQVLQALQSLVPNVMQGANPNPQFAQYNTLNHSLTANLAGAVPAPSAPVHSMPMQPMAMPSVPAMPMQGLGQAVAPMPQHVDPAFNHHQVQSVPGLDNNVMPNQEQVKVVEAAQAKAKAQAKPKRKRRTSAQVAAERAAAQALKAAQAAALAADRAAKAQAEAEALAALAAAEQDNAIAAPVKLRKPRTKVASVAKPRAKTKAETKAESKLARPTVTARWVLPVDKLVAPVVKWVGGKRQLLKSIAPLLPNQIDCYCEPFLGGAALLFAMQPGRAIVNDLNGELMSVYEVIRDDVDNLVDSLRVHENNREYFLELRAKDRDPEVYAAMSKLERASRLLYLNKTCFNGLFRVNHKGQFNSPFGRYKCPNIVNEDIIRAVSGYLNRVEIDFYHEDFAETLKRVPDNGFVYLDPPYDPLSDTSKFVGYNKGGFSREDQIRLKRCCDELDSRGIKFMLSNSATDFILDLYEGYERTLAKATRLINVKANGRGAIDEVIIRNYKD